MYPTPLGSQANPQSQGHQQQSHNPSHNQQHLNGSSPSDNSSSFLTTMGLANVMSIGHNPSTSSTASSPIHQQHSAVSPSPSGFLADGLQQHQSVQQSNHQQHQHGHSGGGFQAYHHGLVSTSMGLLAYPASGSAGASHLHHHPGTSAGSHHHHPSISGLSGLHHPHHHHSSSLSVSSLQQAEKRKQRRIRTTFTSSQLKVTIPPFLSPQPDDNL